MINFFKFLNNFEKKYYFILIFFGVLNSIIEILGLSLMFPLFEILLGDNESRIISFLKKSSLYHYGDEYIFLIIILLIGIVYVIKFFISLLIIYFGNLIKQNIKIQVQKKIMNNFFKRTFLSHSKDSISVQLRTVTTESESALIAVETFFLFIVEILILIFIGFFLFFNFFNISIIMSIILSIVFLIYFVFFNKKIRNLGERRILEENLIFKNIFNSLSIFREIKFLRKESFFLDKIYNNLSRLKKINIINVLIQNFTRNFLELFIVFIILITLYYSKYILDLSNSEIISSLGIFLAAIIRAFPSITKIFNQIQVMTFRNKSTEVISKILNEKETATDKEYLKQKYELNKNISLKNIKFSYSERDLLFNDLNLEIKSNECIGIVGKNGSGKSTLLDILTGVILPDKGEVLVDDISIYKNLLSWQSNIIFLSQKNFLFEGSILSNIILDNKFEQANQSKFLDCLKVTNLEDFILNLPEKENTLIGSNNLNLSGGQQKKIHITRALYHLDIQKKLLIFDEPFENLDLETKSNFLKYINELKKTHTTIIISHQPDDLIICDKLYNVEKLRFV